MQDQLNTVIRQLFQKDSLGDLSEQTLRDFTEKYPYSPIGQLLLAKKLRQSKTDGFEKQAAKSVLYFNNPLWFDWLISMEHVKDDNNDDAIRDTPPPIDPLIAEAIPEDETVQESEQFDDEIIENTGFVAGEPKQTPAENSYNTEETIEEKASTEAESTNEVINEETQVHETSDQVENAPTETRKEGTDTFDDELIENIGFIPEEGRDRPDNSRSSDSPDTYRDRNKEQTEEPGPIESEQSASPEYKNEPQIQHSDNAPVEDQRTDLKKEEEFDDELIENSGFVPEVADHSQTETPPVASDLIEKGPETKETVAGKDDLAFEPYHTIDYFASQGIKLKQEDLEKDKFGKQLKSFTEWLRSMKKIPGSKSPQNLEPEPRDSDTIRKKADESIEGKEVETETMAEVWAKQGNISKAIRIYEKLSLSNPDKSHYFAAKIEQLKAN